MGTLEVSQKRIDANRRNALRSTGPKTAAGKAKSRRNRLIHGLAGEGLVVSQRLAEALVEREEELSGSLNPVNAFEEVLVRTIAAQSLRIDECQDEEQLALAARSRRAALCWDVERKAEIAEMARSLPDRPEVVAARLSLTAPGCDWMITRWRALGHALDTTGVLTDEQISLGLDLLGLDPDVRVLLPLLDPSDESSPLEYRQALVDAQLEYLLALKADGLDQLEEDARQAAIEGRSIGGDKAVRLLRRYEAASFRRMKWAIDLLHKDGPRPKKMWSDHPDWMEGNSVLSDPDDPERFLDPMRSLFADEEPTQPAPVAEPAPAQAVDIPATTDPIPADPRLRNPAPFKPTSPPSPPRPPTPRSRVQARQTSNRKANLLDKLRSNRRARRDEPATLVN